MSDEDAGASCRARGDAHGDDGALSALLKWRCPVTRFHQQAPPFDS